MKNPKIGKIIEEVNNNVASCSKFTWENDILSYKGRIQFPNTSKSKIQILIENHDSLFVGHVGFLKTYYNIRQSLFWKGMKDDIQKYVAECDICQC